MRACAATTNERSRYLFSIDDLIRQQEEEQGGPRAICLALEDKGMVQAYRLQLIQILKTSKYVSWTEDDDENNSRCTPPPPPPPPPIREQQNPHSTAATASRNAPHRNTTQHNATATTTHSTYEFAVPVQRVHGVLLRGGQLDRWRAR